MVFLGCLVIANRVSIEVARVFRKWLLGVYYKCSQSFHAMANWLPGHCCYAVARRPLGSS